MALFETLESADPETLSEILREAECHLQAQLTSGLAADQRAMSFVALLTVATVFVAGAGGALLSADQPSPALGWLCMGLSAVLVVAMFFGILSARPVSFYFAGNNPAHWEHIITKKVPCHKSLAQQAAHYSQMIHSNNRRLRANAIMMTIAIWIVWCGLVATGIAAAAVLLSSTEFVQVGAITL